MIVSATSLLGFSIFETMQMTVFELSAYINRYNDINDFDLDNANDNTETVENIDNSYVGSANLSVLM